MAFMKKMRFFAKNWPINSCFPILNWQNGDCLKFFAAPFIYFKVAMYILLNMEPGYFLGN